MHAEVVEGPGGGVGAVRGGEQAKVEEEGREGVVDVERVEEGGRDLGAGEVAAVVREEVVVGEGVEHGAGGAGLGGWGG